MDHFRQVHQELRNTDTLMEELGYQSANAIIEQIIEQLREEEENMIPPRQPVYEAPPAVTPPPAIPPPSPAPQANAVLPVNLNAAVIQAMMQNMQLMHDNVHQQYYQGRGCGRSRNQGRGRG